MWFATGIKKFLIKCFVIKIIPEDYFYNLKIKHWFEINWELQCVVSIFILWNWYDLFQVQVAAHMRLWMCACVHKRCYVILMMIWALCTRRVRFKKCKAHKKCKHWYTLMELFHHIVHVQNNDCLVDRLCLSSLVLHFSTSQPVVKCL
jgi:hypothetical protein